MAKDSDPNEQLRIQMSARRDTENGRMFQWIRQHYEECNPMILEMLRTRFLPFTLESAGGDTAKEERIVSTISLIEGWIQAILRHHRMSDPRPNIQRNAKSELEDSVANTSQNASNDEPEKVAYLRSLR